MNEELVMKELDIHEKRLNNHSERIDKIELTNSYNNSIKEAKEVGV